MKIVNASGKYPENWRSEVTIDGELVGRVVSYTDSGEVQTIRVRGVFNETVAYARSYRGEIMDMEMVEILATVLHKPEK